MPTVYNGYPSLQAFQTITETDDGDTVAHQLRLQPGELKEIDEDKLEALKADERFQKAVDEGDIRVDPPTDPKRIQNMREELAYNNLSPKYIDRLTAKAKDIKTVGSEQVRQAEQALSGNHSRRLS
jgi:hypothetical protein